MKDLQYCNDKVICSYCQDHIGYAFGAEELDIICPKCQTPSCEWCFKPVEKGMRFCDTHHKILQKDPCA